METKLITIISFSVYTVFIIGLGIYSARHSKRNHIDFFLAGRNLGAWLTSISASASSESGWVMLGLVGAAFSQGIGAFWLIPGCLAGIYVNWFIVADRIRDYSNRNSVVTISDYFSSKIVKHKHFIRFLSAAIIFIAMFVYVSAQFIAAGKAFNSVFNIPYRHGVLIGAIIILIYAVAGGFRAVVWTDFIQGSLIVFTLVIMPFLILFRVGGISPLLSVLKNQDTSLLSLTGGNTGFALIGFILGWAGIGLGYPGLPHVLVRFIASKNKVSIKRGGIIALFWAFFVFSGAIMLGLTTRVYFLSLADAEQALPIAAVQLMPGILSGLVLAAVLGAIASTADSQLMVAASCLANDVIKRLKKNLKDTGQLIVNRLSVLIVGLSALIFAYLEEKVIFTFVLYAWAVLGAAFGPVIILSLCWKKLSTYGTITGMITGALIPVLWRNVEFLSNLVYELIPAFIFSLLCAMVFSILFPDKNNSTIED